MNPQKKLKIAEAHDHLTKALGIVMDNFALFETDSLNKQAGADVESTLRHTTNVFNRLLAHNNQLPLKAQEKINKMYADPQYSESDVEKAEKKAYTYLDAYRYYPNRKTEN